MGRRFVSIHILDSNVDEASKYLYNCCSDRYYDEDYKVNLKGIRSNDISKIFETMSSVKPIEAKFYLTEFNGNVSIFSEYFRTLKVKEQVKRWFSGFDKHILIVDCSEEDYLELSIFRKYKFQTCLVEGKNLEAYQLNRSRFDIEKLCSIFKLETLQVEQAYDLEDLFKTCCNFSDLFKLPLTLNTSDVINSKDMHFEVEEIIW